MTATFTRVDLRVAAARALHEQGYGYRRIGRALGVSASTARRLLDPESADRDRKLSHEAKGRRRRRCACGRLMVSDGSTHGTPATRCKACRDAAAHEMRYWTPDRIIRAFQRFHAAMGRSPTVIDTRGRFPSVARNLSAERLAEIDKAQTLGLTLPHPATVYRELGSWTAALNAAGLPATPVGGARRRSPTNRKVSA